MIIEHNSHNEFFRSPFGACKTGSEINIKLLVFDERLPQGVILHVSGKDYKQELQMEHTGEMIGHSVFEGILKAPETEMILWYWFEVLAYGGVFYYGNNLRAKGGLGLVYDAVPRVKYQITVYRSDYKTPEWFMGQVMYQIFPDRFYNGNEDKSIVKKEGAILHENWNEFPYYSPKQFGGKYLANDFFGGNLLGIIKKLGYLHELGISVLYLNPIFEAFSNHRYDTANYEAVDPILGTNADFTNLCAEAFKVGIRLILDGVFSHTGSDSVYFNKQGKYDSIGAYQSKESPYYNWYSFINYPEKYDCWWGIESLPNVCELEESYRKYILSAEHSIIKQWLLRGAYGWRLDVADELPEAFLVELRQEVKGENEDAVILGEVWEDASNKESYGALREYFLGAELDGVMNYPFRDAIIGFICGRITGWDFNLSLMSLLENYPKEAMYATMNLLSSHDVMRIRHAMAEVPDLDREQQALYVLSEQQKALSRQRQRLAVVMQMTFVGVPCVYYGDEVGMDGYGDPFNRQTFPWDYIDTELLEFYKQIINIRNEIKVLKKGAFKPIMLDKDTYSFVRYSKAGKDAFGNETENGCVLVILNRNEHESARIKLNLSEFGTKKMIELLSNDIVIIDNGKVQLEIEELGYRIYKCE